MVKKLVVNDGTRERELRLVGRIVIGRDPVCDISQDHSLLSRRHAEFVTAEGVVTVRDLGSRNGIFVNGIRAAEQVLEPGDVVQVGPLRARYVVETASAAAAVVKVDAESTAIQSREQISGGTAPSAPPAPMPSDAAALDRRLPSAAFTDGDYDQDETKLLHRRDPAPALSRPFEPVTEDDRTWLVSGPPAAATVDPRAADAPMGPQASVPSGMPPVDVPADTVLLPTPRAEKTASPQMAATPIAASTVVLPPTSTLSAAPHPAAHPSASAPATASSPRVERETRGAAGAQATKLDERALKNLVLVHLLVAVAIVVAAGAVPFMILRAFLAGAASTPSVFWLALPMAVGVATALVLSGRIAHEIAALIGTGDRART